MKSYADVLLKPFVQLQRIVERHPARIVPQTFMALIFLVFLGGALTALSPCILRAPPMVFARADQPFLRNGLIDAAGNGSVRDQRLYRMIRQSKHVHEHEFKTQFLEPGVTAQALTFG